MTLCCFECFLCCRPRNSSCFFFVDNHVTIIWFSLFRTTWLSAVFCVGNHMTLWFPCFRPRDYISAVFFVSDHLTLSCFSFFQTTWLSAIFFLSDHVTLSCFLSFRLRDYQLFSFFQTTWLSAIFCLSDHVTLSFFLSFRPRDSQLFSLFQTTWTCRMWGYPTRIQTRGRSGFPHYNSAQILTCIFVPILSIFPSYIYCTLNKDKDGVRSNWANGRTDPLLSPDGIH